MSFGAGSDDKGVHSTLTVVGADISLYGKATARRSCRCNLVNDTGSLLNKGEISMRLKGKGRASIVNISQRNEKE